MLNCPQYSEFHHGWALRFLISQLNLISHETKLSILNVQCHASSITSTNTPVLCWQWVILLISVESLSGFVSLVEQRLMFVPDFVLFVEQKNVEQKTEHEEHKYLSREENKKLLTNSHPPLNCLLKSSSILSL